MESGTEGGEGWGLRSSSGGAAGRGGKALSAALLPVITAKVRADGTKFVALPVIITLRGGVRNPGLLGGLVGVLAFRCSWVKSGTEGGGG
ncbi:hypothetical protein GCM10009799_21080 [Nocardiopsis rhodophaea]|uniref:Uncharacterized protein n=1 Tax=Nocardiopsis rhodophaea TaxID=280238 RepID=A0ABN2SZC5_9ACTN